MKRLENKVAIVTGAANGIGRAIAELFAEEGAFVTATDIEIENGEEMVEGIRLRGGQAQFCRADVTHSSDARAAAAAAADHSGRIDILCNNAAYLGQFHAVLESTDAEWERCLQTSVMGTHFFTREVLPYMIKQRAGSIVNIVSIQAMVGCMTSVAYTSAKAALLGYTLSAAYDYGPHNVRVNSLCPGPIQTRISPAPDDPHYRWQCEQTMLGRVGYPKEVAYAALFLASEEASYITGATLPVDGGWTAK
jgi:NAD(P)-dependent dehydrogenase (short-subunit alcohol dehydrogenase family)